MKIDKNLKRINKISQKIGILNACIFGGVFELRPLRGRNSDIKFDRVRVRRPSARASVSRRVAVAETRHHRAAFARFRRKLRRRRGFCGGFRGGFWGAGCHNVRNVRAQAGEWQAKNARPTVYKRARARPNSSGGVFCIFFRGKLIFLVLCPEMITAPARATA